MDAEKRKRLQKRGWKIGGTQEFLDLTVEEMALIETRVAIADSLRQRRAAAKLSQAALAKRIGSSQSRVAKIEAADPSVGLELTVRAFFATGGTKAQLADAIRRKPKTAVG